MKFFFFNARVGGNAVQMKFLPVCSYSFQMNSDFVKGFFALIAFDNVFFCLLVVLSITCLNMNQFAKVTVLCLRMVQNNSAPEKLVLLQCINRCENQEGYSNPTQTAKMGLQRKQLTAFSRQAFKRQSHKVVKHIQAICRQIV